MTQQILKHLLGFGLSWESPRQAVFDLLKRLMVMNIYGASCILAYEKYYFFALFLGVVAMILFLCWFYEG